MEGNAHLRKHCFHAYLLLRKKRPFSLAQFSIFSSAFEHKFTGTSVGSLSFGRYGIRHSHLNHMLGRGVKETDPHEHQPSIRLI